MDNIREKRQAEAANGDGCAENGKALEFHSHALRVINTKEFSLPVSINKEACSLPYDEISPNRKPQDESQSSARCFFCSRLYLQFPLNASHPALAAIFSGEQAVVRW